jgi:hypothetical protein
MPLTLFNYHPDPHQHLNLWDGAITARWLIDAHRLQAMQGRLAPHKTRAEFLWA